MSISRTSLEVAPRSGRRLHRISAVARLATYTSYTRPPTESAFSTLVNPTGDAKEKPAGSGGASVFGGNRDVLTHKFSSPDSSTVKNRPLRGGEFWRFREQRQEEAQ